MVKQIVWGGGSIPSYPSFLTDNQQKQIGVKKAREHERKCLITAGICIAYICLQAVK